MIRILFALCLISVSSCKFNTEKNTVPANRASAVEILPQDPYLKESKERGGLIYTDFCMQCHLGNGKGVPETFPPLAGSNWLIEKRTESIHAVKFGQQGEIIVNGTLYNGYMAPMGLTDEEIADVMNYIMNSWGNRASKAVTPEEVAAVKK